MYVNGRSFLPFISFVVQAAVQSNVFAVSGAHETKKLQDLLPGIVSHLGADNLAQLKKMAEQAYAAQATKPSSSDEVPDLVENFEEVSKN